MRNIVKFLCVSMSLFLLTGCGKLEQNIELKNDGSGVASVNFVVRSEFEDEIQKYIDEEFKEDEVKKVTKRSGGKDLTAFIIEKPFDNYEELGYEKSEFKIEKLNNDTIYTIRINNDIISSYDDVIKRMNESLEDNNVSMKFSITLKGHLLTNVKTSSTNSTDIKKYMFPAETVYTWDIKDNSSFELTAKLTGPVIEINTAIGCVVLIGALSAIFVTNKKYSKKNDKKQDD